MSSPVAETLASRLRAVRRSQRAAVATPTPARTLVWVAFGPALAALALMVLVALIALSSSPSLTGLARTVATMWLASHQVPVTIAEVTVGILPLAPTLIILAIVSVTVRRSLTASAAPNLGIIASCVIGGPLLVTALALAITMDAATVSNLQSPSAALSFVAVVVVHGLGMVLGARDLWWPPLRDRLGLTGWGVTALRAAAAGLLILIAFSAALITVRLVVAHSQVSAMLGTGSGFTAVFSLAGLSILYLPNVVIAGAALLVGGNVHVGIVNVSAFDNQPGRVPPVPILGVMPSGPVASWLPVLLVAAVVAAVVVAWRTRDGDLWQHLRKISLAAICAATAVVIATAAAGGQLGELGSAGANIPAAGVFTFAWFSAVGVAVAVGFHYLGGRFVSPALDTPVVDGTANAAANDPAVDDPAFDDPAFDDPAFDDPAADDDTAAGDAVGDWDGDAPAADVTGDADQDLSYSDLSYSDTDDLVGDDLGSAPDAGQRTDDQRTGDRVAAAADAVLPDAAADDGSVADFAPLPDCDFTDALSQASAEAQRVRSAREALTDGRPFSFADADTAVIRGLAELAAAEAELPDLDQVPDAAERAARSADDSD